MSRIRIPWMGRWAYPAVLLVVVGWATPLGSGSAVVRGGARSASAGARWADVIVVLRGKCTPAREAVLRKAGADVYRHLPLIHGLAVRIPARSQSRLAALPFVAHISPDLAVRKCDEFTVGSSKADVAYQQTGLTGTGIGVAVLDSGVQPCADLADPVTGLSRIVATANFAFGSTTTNDRCGHGSHVAGIIAGNAASSTGGDFFRSFLGIAPACNILNVKVLDLNGQGTVSGVIAGLQWVVNNRAAYNIRVINLSLGHPQGESYTTDPLCQAVEAAWQSGIVVVCAAGNGGRLNASPTLGAANEGFGTTYGSIQSPANDPYVITVGATKSLDGVRADDRIATYSGRGPSRLDFVLKPDLVAPGNRVVSLNVPNSTLTNYSDTNLIPFSYYCYNSSPAVSCRYFRLSGTSMAAPVVTGAVALMLQADPSLSPNTVKARLMLSADKWSVPGGTMDACTFGAGYLNIPAALSNTTVATQPALSPTLYRDQQGGVHINAVGLLGNSQYIWGDTDLPLGDPNTPSLQYIWGEQYILGENTLASSQFIWGEAIWSDQYVWGETSTAVDLTSTAITGEP